ncbi:MAG: TetR-like C-terminal domain-containing protein, partial [bacterium]|nr:TetR-like C-terminal domain-containing protein [bacterium]
SFATMVHACVLAPRHRVMRELIEAGIASGELRPDLDADTAIPILVGPMIYLSKQNISSSLAHVSVEAVLDVLMAGMAPGSITAGMTPAISS